MSNQRFANVWDTLEDTQTEAENMKLRSALMTALKQHITRVKMSQAEAAKLRKAGGREPDACMFF